MARLWQGHECGPGPRLPPNIGYRLGRKLKWDPAKEDFVGDPEASKELSREARGEWKKV